MTKSETKVKTKLLKFIEECSIHFYNDSSFHLLILLSNCSFSYNGVYYDCLEISICDIIVSRKGSNEEWK